MLQVHLMWRFCCTDTCHTPHAWQDNSKTIWAMRGILHGMEGCKRGAFHRRDMDAIGSVLSSQRQVQKDTHLWKETPSQTMKETNLDLDSSTWTKSDNASRLFLWNWASIWRECEIHQCTTLSFISCHIPNFSGYFYWLNSKVDCFPVAADRITVIPERLFSTFANICWHLIITPY